MDKLLRESGVEFEKINYYLQPLSEKKLRELIKKMGIKPRDLLRSGEPRCGLRPGRAGIF